jgi:hypothetical protein
MKLMFCMFVEGIDLLPDKLFTKLPANAKSDPGKVAGRLWNLFQAMARGGDFGTDAIDHFNGGLFADADLVELTCNEIECTPACKAGPSWYTTRTTSSWASPVKPAPAASWPCCRRGSASTD